MVSADSVSLTDKKRTLRLAMTAKRSQLAPSERTRARAAAGARLLALSQLSAAIRDRKVVAGFASTRNEIDPAPALAEARERGALLAYPRIGDGRPRMRFHVAAPEQLRPGRFGILEPEPSCREVDATEIALMIVPGLAFDLAGHRLGSGGGYYDEWLGEAADAAPDRRCVIGLAYDFQLIGSCPAGERDARVDGVVTDRRTVLGIPSPGDSPESDDHSHQEPEDGGS